MWENWDDETGSGEADAADEGEGDYTSCWLDTELVLSYGFTESCNLENTLLHYDRIARSVPTPELIKISLLAFLRSERPLPPEFGPTMLGATMEKLRRILLRCAGVAEELVFSERVRSQMLENLQHAHLLQASKVEGLRTSESQIRHWLQQGVLSEDPNLDKMPNRRMLTACDIMSAAGWSQTKESGERIRRISAMLAEVGDAMKDQDGSTHQLMTLVVLTNGLRSKVDGRSLQGTRAVRSPFYITFLYHTCPHFDL